MLSAPAGAYQRQLAAEDDAHNRIVLWFGGGAAALVLLLFFLFRVGTGTLSGPYFPLANLMQQSGSGMPGMTPGPYGVTAPGMPGATPEVPGLNPGTPDTTLMPPRSYHEMPEASPEMPNASPTRPQKPIYTNYKLIRTGGVSDPKDAVVVDKDYGERGSNGAWNITGLEEHPQCADRWHHQISIDR